MTGSNTEPASTPAHVQASAIVLRICNPLFRAWMNATTEDPMDPYYNAWFALRRIHELFGELRGTKLPGRDRAQLIAALKVAHDLAHDYDTENAPPVDVCHCTVSEAIRDLAGLMALEAR